MTMHGLFRNGAKPESYGVWASMKARCSNSKNPNYKHYGGRGIKVCERWQKSFADFSADMGPRPPGTTLDRYPNMDGDYGPGNCRWATHEQQQNNKKDNHFVTVEGRTQTITQWARETGIPKGTIANRLARGCPEELCLGDFQRSQARMIEFNGERMCLTDWARRVGIAATTLHDRLQREWPLERALSTPKGGSNV